MCSITMRTLKSAAKVVKISELCKFYLKKYIKPLNFISRNYIIPLKFVFKNTIIPAYTMKQKFRLLG